MGVGGGLKVSAGAVMRMWVPMRRRRRRRGGEEDNDSVTVMIIITISIASATH